MEKPDARLEAEIVIRERADRADFRDVAGVGVVDLLIADGAA
jgi:hypothetical protein